MNDFIINRPELQSAQSRFSGILVWITCWILWLYLLLPIITLGIWLSDNKKLIPEMRWFGGYKSLLELLEIYLWALVVIAVFWIIWVLLHSLRRHPVIPPATRKISDLDLCQFYQISNDQLQHARFSSNVTVYFDETGRILALETNEHS